jgi:predicted nucleic acid-binding protein
VNGVVYIDASVAVKWLAPELDRDIALGLLGDARASGTRIVTPPHFEPEVTSAITAKFREGSLILAEAVEALEELAKIGIEVIRQQELNQRAFELALEFGWAYPYDAFYLAVGELLDCDVWTADSRFHRAAAQRYPRLRLLTDYGLAH